MDRSRQRWKSAMLAAGACCLLVAACDQPKHGGKPSNPPNVEGLREALQRSAEAALPAPSLVSQRVVIEVKPGEFDSKAEEVKRIGAELGATLLPGANSPAQSGTSFLLRMPEERVAEFTHRAQAGFPNVPTKGNEPAVGAQFDTHLANPLEPALVEVFIQPQYANPAASTLPEPTP